MAKKPKPADRLPTEREVLEALVLAAERADAAYSKYGPVEDGRPEGRRFERALDRLSKALIEAKVFLDFKKKRGAFAYLRKERKRV
jgi:hypothetical protein